VAAAGHGTEGGLYDGMGSCGSGIFYYYVSGREERGGGRASGVAGGWKRRREGLGRRDVRLYGRRKEGGVLFLRAWWWRNVGRDGDGRAWRRLPPLFLSLKHNLMPLTMVSLPSSSMRCGR